MSSWIGLKFVTIASVVQRRQNGHSASLGKRFLLYHPARLNEIDLEHQRLNRDGIGRFQRQSDCYRVAKFGRHHWNKSLPAAPC